MKAPALAVARYWENKSPYFTFDSETLTAAVMSLSDSERATILGGDSVEPELHNKYVFVMNKAFNRHNDICNGDTDILDDGSLDLSANSSITELSISYDTLVDCNKNMFYKICDIEKETLPTLSFAAIADVTSALIRDGIVQICE